MAAIPLISTTALTGMPEFIERELGRKTLVTAFCAAEIPLDILNHRPHFIPQRSFHLMLESIARQSGERNFGLLLVPNLNFNSWGPFAQYVNAGTSMKSAIGRTKAALSFHGTQHQIDCSYIDQEVNIHYKVPTSNVVGYRHFTVCAAQILITLVGPYLKDNTPPVRIEFDIPKPRDHSIYESLFNCPVLFDRSCLSIVFDRNSFRPQAKISTENITFSDLFRLIRKDTPHSFYETLAELMRVRLYEGEINIDRIAAQMGMGPRTLQRRLQAENLNFRDLALKVRTERAIEMLRETDASITEIGLDLGYSSSAHFARAIKNCIGFTPREIRAQAGPHAAVLQHIH